MDDAAGINHSDIHTSEADNVIDTLDRLAVIYNNISTGAQLTDAAEQTLKTLEQIMLDVVQELRPLDPPPTKEAT